MAQPVNYGPMGSLAPEYVALVNERIRMLYPLHEPPRVLELYHAAAAADKEFEQAVLEHVKSSGKVDIAFLAYALYCKEYGEELLRIARSSYAHTATLASNTRIH